MTRGRAKKKVVQYTIRDVPPAVDAALRRRAKELKKSLNRVAAEALAAGVGVKRRYADLDDLIGSWVEDPKVDEALADQRKIDRELWK